MSTPYLFKSERLGFRNFVDADLEPFAELCGDPEVMEHFAKTLTLEETADLVQRIQAMYHERGYTYFATEVLETGQFIGMIGLAYQDYVTEFTPAVDIGWRLKKTAWGKGYATEGARRCLEFGFQDIGLKHVISTCTQTNINSENVMKKIGMTKMGEFIYPPYKDLEKKYAESIWYEITA